MPDFTRYLIADTFFNRISFLDSKGFLVNVTGKTGEAAGEFSEPAAVTSAAGLIFVADKYNCRICVYDIKGVFKYAFSSKGSGEAQLYLPSALRAVGTDEVYICDSGNDRIQVFSFKGKHIKSIGRRGRSKGFFNAPSDICFDSNSNFYVADSYNRRIQKFTFDGRFICEINRLESSFLSSDYKPDFYYKMPRNYDSNEINFSLGELIMPLKIDVDNDTSFLYVLDSIHKKIYVLDCDNFNKGRELYFARNFKDAIKYLSIAADENPRNLNALYYLGYCNQQIFDYKKAYECYKKIINYHSAGEVEKHAKYQLKKIAAMNSPDYFSKVEEKENIDKKREEIKQTYVKFFGSTDEITAFDRMREMYFKEYEIKIPSKYDLHYEKKEYNLDDDEYYEEWK